MNTRPAIALSLLAPLALFACSRSAKPSDPGRPHTALTSAPNPSSPVPTLDFKSLEAPLLTNHVQLTSRDMFVKAGEAYFDHHSPPRWIIFQAVAVPDLGHDPDPFYAMYVARLRYDQTGIVGLEHPTRISPDNSANTCGWFNPVSGDNVLFASTLVKPGNTQRPGFQVGTRRYVWMFPHEMEVVSRTLPDVFRDIHPNSPQPEWSGDAIAAKPVFTRPNYDAECSYSNDGRFILYAHVRDEPTRGKDDADIWVYDTQTGRQHEIVHADGYDGGPFFSPDNKRICFRSDRVGNDLLQLYVADLQFDSDGVPIGAGREYPLTANEHVNWAPFWHPSGKFLIYGTSEMGHTNYEIFAVEVPPPGSSTTPDQLRRRRITYATGADVLPVFSDDGTYMMWTAQRGPMAQGDTKPSSQIWAARFNPIAIQDVARFPLFPAGTITELVAHDRVTALLKAQESTAKASAQAAGGSCPDYDLRQLRLVRISQGWRGNVNVWNVPDDGQYVFALSDGRVFCAPEYADPPTTEMRDLMNAPPGTPTMSKKPSPTPSSVKPWEHAKHGEGSATDPLATRFVESLSYDTRLYAADIRGSLSHAHMLTAVGLITRDDYIAIERALSEIIREIERAPAGPTAVGVAGAWPGWKVELEDVHMCIEAALVERIGDAGRKLHTGRSRNDQVALDLRLWIREACATLSRRLSLLQSAFVSLATAQGDTVIPTYTHVQRAQPAVLGAECMAWWAMFARDARLFQAMPGWEDGLAASPLGAGAVAGSTLPLDRAQTARDLGFAAPSLSSIDSTASRDEAIDFLHACSRTAMHLSRLAEQWILYCSTEFGFLSLGEAYTTGSSMMPQKRNPDMLELIRGRCGNIYGNYAALSTILKGLPLAYNRDLQEDKRHVFAAFDTLKDSIEIASRIVESARFNAERIASTLNRGHLDATVLAEYLVEKGVPFRTAHQVVGHLVRVCDRTKRHSLALLDLDEIRDAVRSMGHSVKIDQDVFDHLGAANVVKRYRTSGHAGSSAGGYQDWLLLASPQTPMGVWKALRPHTDAGSAEPPSSPPNTGPSRSPNIPRPRPASLFPAANKGAPGAPDDRSGKFDFLIAAYKEGGRTLDDLPYTDEFEAIFIAANNMHPELNKYAIFRRLHNLRKAGKLPKVGKAATLPVKLEPKEESWLRGRVVETVGTLGQRDQLPYDARFDTLVEQFNAHTGRTLSPHDVWRLVAKLAK